MRRNVEAFEVTAKWEERLHASEQEKFQLKIDLDEAESKSAELLCLRTKISDGDQRTLQHEERTRELSESIAVLERQLKEQENDAVDAIEEWMKTCSNLEVKCANLELDLKESNETVSTRGWSMEQLKSCSDNYSIHIEKLKTTSQTVESSLRADLATAESAISRLEDALETERKSWMGQHEQLHADLNVEKERNNEAKDEIESLSSSLEEIKNKSKETLNQWTGTFMCFFRRFHFFVNLLTIIRRF